MSKLHFITAFLAVIALVFSGAFLLGVWWESQNQTIRDLEDYKEGTEDASDATSDLPDDDSGNLEWLHEWLGR